MQCKSIFKKLFERNLEKLMTKKNGFMQPNYSSGNVSFNDDLMLQNYGQFIIKNQIRHTYDLNNNIWTLV